MRLSDRDGRGVRGRFRFLFRDQGSEKQLKALQNERNTLRAIAAGDPVDVRGRHAIEDFEQFALPAQIEGQVESLLKQAAGKSNAQAAFDQAKQLLAHAESQAADIDHYWHQKPAILWRERWRLFAVANGLSPEPPKPVMVDLERQMLEELSNGDFHQPATFGAVMLEKHLKDAIYDATAELAHADRELQFIARKSSCPNSSGSGAKAPRIARAGSPEDYYPPGAVRREEEGSIVLRARIAPDNCATHVAIVVSSGYSDLDAAAIQVFEATTFLAASENGVPQKGELSFKVKFEIKD